MKKKTRLAVRGGFIAETEASECCARRRMAPRPED